LPGNKKQVRGTIFPAHHPSKMDEFRRLEKEARKKRNGLWSAEACKNNEPAGGS
jgi:endonuclease YncB( thermonuclease family)